MFWSFSDSVAGVIVGYECLVIILCFLGFFFFVHLMMWSDMMFCPDLNGLSCYVQWWFYYVQRWTWRMPMSIPCSGVTLGCFCLPRWRGWDTIYGPYDNDIMNSVSGDWHFDCSFYLLGCVWCLVLLKRELCWIWSGWASFVLVYFAQPLSLNLALFLAQLGFDLALSKGFWYWNPFGPSLFYFLTRYVFY